jgi:hypothetical protein
VNVEDMPAPRFEVDAARAAEANAAIKAMQDEARADGMVLEENVLPKVSPQETVARAKAAPEAGKPATEAAEPVDPLATEALRFATENPDLPMFVGKNADGSDITTTPAKWLEDADAAMRQANDDVKLFEIAAGCLLGGGR